MKFHQEGKTVDFLLDASLLYKETCPELSRFLLQCPVKANEQRKHGPSTLLQNTSVCQYCYQWLHPINYRMRIRPKRRPSARVQSVLRRKARGKRLSLMQKDLLQRFQKSSPVLSSLCNSFVTDGAAECRLSHRAVEPSYRALVSPPLSPAPLQR
ncbi:hypothetical protein JOQ06_016147 [Pogonophryne albipinna]|uniref:Uncharacterized protein n=1 Tax=Pogonophryne albipinna TaxID=1090488 RepID=A0AAD6AMQ5_9TELE|nr:hypothetical protein JOQ06_016147 [Pogonophryne albipinna]